MLDVSTYRALSFDCYGTLIDWDTGLAGRLGPWADAHGVRTDMAELLGRFADAQFREQSVRPAKNYRQVVGAAFDALGAAAGAAVSAGERAALVESIGTWPPFPDTVAALRALKRRGRVLGVVSNVDRASFARTHRLLDGLLDVVVTAEEVGAYKPAPEMFEALIEAFAERGIGRSEILHVAQSRFHDIGPAGAHGLATVWVDRRAGRPGRGVTLPSEAEPLLRVESLAELIALLERESAAG
ncbi:MAG: HAD-IA family hydrolase [Pseudomonadales bacterium]|jgi:2-haloalkanoic acid dehalogenase type II|nr:HAD-IA family hydrolase [Pseudomonadales bacterium]